MSRRALVSVLAVCVGLVLQTTLLPHLAWDGVTADLVLVVVVAAGVGCGSQFGMVLGFAAGLLLDLAPPADHVAGRWALALLAVGYVAGRVRLDLRPSVPQAIATVAACSFLGSSLFALSGLVLQDRPLAVPELLPVVLVGVLLDVVAAALVVPGLLRVLARPEPRRVFA